MYHNEVLIGANRSIQYKLLLMNPSTSTIRVPKLPTLLIHNIDTIIIHVFDYSPRLQLLSFSCAKFTPAKKIST